jgi:predicted type IV restriction endonuclease
MEELLNYNWNVYKVFKNGKRAKSPITTFESEEENASEVFELKVKAGFPAKLKKSKFVFIREDSEQARESEIIDTAIDLFMINKQKVLSTLLTTKNLDADRKPKLSVSGALILCKDSGWKWQWAAIEAVTSKYIVGLSETFGTSKEADEWMQEQIKEI